ncbi:MAG: 3-deoxy-7-phosphoheptulonate synthase [Myxococcota bacterium]|jgi:3-deoxy-7-phosphoheptulonate synthase
MIIVLKPGTTEEKAGEILKRVGDMGLKPLYMPGLERTVLGAIGDERVLASLHLENLPEVESVTAILSPYKLVSREMHPHDTIVSVGGRVMIGGERFVVMAGPCAIESEEQLRLTAEAVKGSGAQILRGGAFKPRSSPYAFQGLGLEGLKILASVSKATGLPTVTEVIDVHDIDKVAQYADMMQVGARNMQNFALLQELGRCKKPVLLKRGMAATFTDLLLAAEYIVSEGNPDVILCERGLKTFETATRNTLDLSAVPYIKLKSHLPVIVDPSHGTGVRELVSPMSRAAAACGADGLMIEAHINPAQALSDGQQSLSQSGFADLMRGLAPFVEAAGRRL